MSKKPDTLLKICERIIKMAYPDKFRNGIETGEFIIAESLWKRLNQAVKREQEKGK